MKTAKIILLLGCLILFIEHNQMFGLGYIACYPCYHHNLRSMTDCPKDRFHCGNVCLLGHYWKKNDANNCYPIKLEQGPPTSKSIKVGESYEIMCRFTGPVEIVFLKNDNVIYPTGRYRIRNETFENSVTFFLQISDARMTDNASYYCAIPIKPDDDFTLRSRPCQLIIEPAAALNGEDGDKGRSGSVNPVPDNVLMCSTIGLCLLLMIVFQ